MEGSLNWNALEGEKLIKKVLIIGLVWPEPTSSAAGTRMMQLIQLFLSAGYEVIFASAASKSAYSADLPALGIQECPIVLNDVGFNHWIRALAPDLVTYDRFLTEEQYGWRVTQECPQALTLLDTEDLHFLRLARQVSVKKKQPIDIFSDTAKRELASILRCDLSLIISEYEMELLKEHFGIAPSIIYHLPFMEAEITVADLNNWKSYHDRQHFVFIGNFLHEPNVDAVQTLKAAIWPSIRQQMPQVKLHIYGAYTPQKIQQLHQPKEGFCIMGRAVDARETLEKYRVLLAPLRFGAGAKGKFIDAMKSGTPSVTSVIGAESMRRELPWGGRIADEPEAFAQSAIRLYENRLHWQKAQENGIRIVNERYQGNRFEQPFLEKLQSLHVTLKFHRQRNFIGQILQLQVMQSTKYMSLWIEEKSRK